MTSKKSHWHYPTIIVWLTASALFAVGVWEIDRAKQKQILRTQLKTFSQQPPEILPKNNALTRFKSYRATGHYRNEKTLLLDHQINQQHYVGYQVITPFALANNHRWLLVNRGWIPHHLMDQKLPHPMPIHGKQTIQGFAYYPKPGFKLASIHTPHLINRIEPDQLAKRMHHRLYQGVLVLQDHQPGSYQMNTPIEPTMTPETHLGYAAEFFSLACLMIIIYYLYRKQSG